MTRVWKDNLTLLSGLGETVRDLGCRQEKRDLYRCEALSESKGSYTASLLYWSRKADLAVIQVTSRSSQTTSRQLLGQLKFKFADRAPAGANRGATRGAKR